MSNDFDIKYIGFFEYHYFICELVALAWLLFWFVACRRILLMKIFGLSYDLVTQEAMVDEIRTSQAHFLKIPALIEKVYVRELQRKEFNNPASLEVFFG